MDTTEEVYHLVKDQAKHGAALYSYMYKKDDIIHIDNMCVAFATSDEKNIWRLREKSKVDGFMFWAESEQGKMWRKENMRAISSALLSMMQGSFNGGRAT